MFELIISHFKKYYTQNFHNIFAGLLSSRCTVWSEASEQFWKLSVMKLRFRIKLSSKTVGNEMSLLQDPNKLHFPQNLNKLKISPSAKFLINYFFFLQKLNKMQLLQNLNMLYFLVTYRVSLNDTGFFNIIHVWAVDRIWFWLISYTQVSSLIFLMTVIASEWRNLCWRHW